MDKQFYTAEELEEMFGICKRNCYSGRVVGTFRVGRSLRFRKEEIDYHVKSGKNLLRPLPSKRTASPVYTVRGRQNGNQRKNSTSGD